MKKKILEAWRNEEYYLTLSEKERAEIPEHPAGILDIQDDVLKSISGGCGPSATSAFCTPCPPKHCY